MSVTQLHHIDWNEVQDFDSLNDRMGQLCADLDETLEEICATAGTGSGSSTATGTVTGPATSVDGNVVMFDGTDGQTLADSGVSAASLMTIAQVAARIAVGI